MVQNGAFPCFGKLRYKRSLPVVSNHQLCEYSSTAYTLQIIPKKRWMNFYRNQKSITLESIFFVHHIFLWCVSKKKIALKKKIRLQNKFDEKKTRLGQHPALKTHQVRAPHRAPPVLPPWLFQLSKFVVFKNARSAALEFFGPYLCWELLFFFKVRASFSVLCVRTRAFVTFFFCVTSMACDALDTMYISQKLALRFIDFQLEMHIL